jgi:HK97 family phage major capsid protein
MNELIVSLKKKLGEMQKVEATGFTDEKSAAGYFREKEVFLEDMARALEAVAAETAEVAVLKAGLKSLRDELKGQVKYPKELSLNEFYYKLGRGLAAVYTRNNQGLAELGYTPNLKSESWTNPKECSWVAGSGWQVRSSLGDPMGDMSSSDAFLIAPTYERELVSVAEAKSVMMPLVSSTLMTSTSRIIPVEEPGGIKLEWQTTYGDEIKGTKPKGPEKVELKVLTVAGFIPFFDEFEDDVFIDLGKHFVKKFTSAYALEFDRQCLVAAASPFTGALMSNRGSSVVVKGSAVKDICLEDFQDAVYKVPAEERKNCVWFLHETVLNHIMKLKDANGNPIVRKPGEKMPGVIDLYPYHECQVMPQFSDIKAGEPFAVFINPQRIEHGYRRGIELRRFDDTGDSLRFGTVALRFRKRDAFTLAIPKGHHVCLRTKGPAGGGSAGNP